jgi:hypothetical protein
VLCATSSACSLIAAALSRALVAVFCAQFSLPPAWDGGEEVGGTEERIRSRVVLDGRVM